MLQYELFVSSNTPKDKETTEDNEKTEEQRI
jgi:hypothetical protein